MYYAVAIATTVFACMLILGIMLFGIISLTLNGSSPDDLIYGAGIAVTITLLATFAGALTKAFNHVQLIHLTMPLAIELGAIALVFDVLTIVMSFRSIDAVWHSGIFVIGAVFTIMMIPIIGEWLKHLRKKQTASA